METRNAHCPRCGCQVRLAWTESPAHEGHAPVADGGELVCLEVRDCEEGRCPLSGEPSAVMVARLARSGLAPERFRHVRMACGGCDAVTEMEVLGGKRLRCTVCGAMNGWMMDELLGGVT